MRLEPERVAERLGLDPATIGRLQALGHLDRLALTDRQIRARLYNAHLVHLHSARGTQASKKEKS
jgi:hypothetical protein